MRLFRGAPVPMTPEGGAVGRFGSPPGPLGTFGSKSLLCALTGRLEALVASAPIFRPLHSLLDLAGGLGFLPFGAALLQPLARGELPRRRRLLCLGLLLL